MSRAAALLFAGLLALTAAAGAALTVGARPPAREEQRAEEFQRLVGGLGFGPALDLERCAFAFDPRLDPGCSEDVGPVPGGGFFCPHHACSVFDYPPCEDGRVTR
jgi:hypothetical protein